MDVSKIPNKLRGEPYFCLMKFEQKPGKVKKDKVPYRTNGARADPTTPEHFTSLENYKSQLSVNLPPTTPEHFTSLENVMKVFDEGGSGLKAYYIGRKEGYRVEKIPDDTKVVKVVFNTY